MQIDEHDALETRERRYGGVTRVVDVGALLVLLAAFALSIALGQPVAHPATHHQARHVATCQASR